MKGLEKRRERVTEDPLIEVRLPEDLQGASREEGNKG